MHDLSTKSYLMATTQIIEDITSHPDADRLDLATVIGFTCIVPKDAYKKGDVIIFIEPDNCLPDDPWAIEHKKYAKKRIKAIKIRGIWSEGLVLDPKIFGTDLPSPDFKLDLAGIDLSELMNITHYEESGNDGIEGYEGSLPHRIPKTDENRWEKIKNRIPWGELVDVSLKVDGESCSYFYHLATKQFGVTSRRISYDPETENNFTSHLARYQIREKLTKFCEEKKISICLRGESYGLGIHRGSDQNPHAKMEPGWMLFSVWLMDERRYTNLGDPLYFRTLAAYLDLPTVPLIEENVPLTPDLVNKYSITQKKIDGKPFEGVVIKSPTMTFKVINKDYDSKK